MPGESLPRQNPLTEEEMEQYYGWDKSIEPKAKEAQVHGQDRTTLSIAISLKRIADVLEAWRGGNS